MQPQPPTPQTSFRQTLQFYLIDSHSLLGKVIDIVIIALNLVVCALFVVDTYPLSESAQIVIWQIEIVIVGLFVVEYAARLYGAPNRWKQLRDIFSVIDLVAIVPTAVLLIFPLFGLTPAMGFLKLIRVLRVFRIFRFLRFTRDAAFFFGEITLHLLNVLRFFLTILILFFISAGMFYHVENAANALVNNFGDAFYYTVVTLTTVGFGDIIPITEAGKWVTVGMILSGIILIPWQATRIVREWIWLAKKADVVCRQCGLRYHDRDASHCKSCGAVVYQVYDDQGLG